MLGNAHFYNRTIRKVVVGFGTLFNDIQLIRYTRDMATEVERFKVPLSYGAKEKYLTRLASDPDLTKSIAITDFVRSGSEAKRVKYFSLAP